jgi:drug/metabolite transporter (DMT)-like permease
VAVYLGWLFLHEKVDGAMFAGTVVILAAVAMVNLSKLKAMQSGTVKEKKEVPLIEVAGN